MEQPRRSLAPTPRQPQCPHRHLPKLPKRPDAQHARASTAHTKPTCCGSISRLLRTLRGRRGAGSAIPKRLCAVPGRGWGASAAGVLSVAKWPWGWSGRCEVQRRGAPGQSFMARGRGWRGGGGARRGRSSESRAQRARSAHHGSVARRRRRHGGAGGPGSRGWRSPGAGAATWPLCLGALAGPQPWLPRPGPPAGSTQCAPAPRAAARVRSILPLQVWRQQPDCDAPLLPSEPSTGGPVRAAGRQTGRAGAAPLAASDRDVGPPGASSPRELSLRLPAPASAMPWRLPPATHASLPSRPPPPPPQHVYSSPKAHSPPCSSLPPVGLNYRPR